MGKCACAGCEQEGTFCAGHYSKLVEELQQLTKRVCEFADRKKKQPGLFADELLMHRGKKAIENHRALDAELKQTIEHTSHLRELLSASAVVWWEKMCAIYEPQAELYLLEEIAKADAWCECHLDRRPRSLRGAEQFMSNWLRRAADNARVTATKVEATRRLYATQAPKRGNGTNGGAVFREPSRIRGEGA